MVGTPIFMAPEVLNGIPYKRSADIWSLGIVLVHLAVLENPFRTL